MNETKLVARLALRDFVLNKMPGRRAQKMQTIAWIGQNVVSERETNNCLRTASRHVIQNP